MSALSAAASKEDGDTIKNLQARVADLEAQLYAVGAGGVGKMEQPQVEQEPVAYYVMNGVALFQLFRSKSQADALAYDLQKRHDLSGSPAHFHVVPLYTRPQPKRQPLTDERIYKMGLEHKRIAKDGAEWFDRESFARAIEAAHEIGGEAKTRMCPSTYYECSRGCGDGGCKDFSDAHGIGGEA